MPMINIRISQEEKERLTEVAEAMGLSLSAFLRQAAVRQAHRVLGPPKVVPAAGQTERNP
jgi:uncharacterized protein (DUF1778 family)